MKARAVAYLLRGEVGAPLESREIGMAERMLGTASSPSRLVRLSDYTVSSDIAGVERYFRQALGYGATFDLVVVGAIRGKGHGREAMDRCFLLPSILLRTDITPRIFR